MTLMPAPLHSSHRPPGTLKENTPASETLKLQNVSKRNYLLPLPQDQLILNPNLTQNWGYSGETGDGPYDNTFE